MMLPTACILMSPIKAINNYNGHPDIYVTVTGMSNGAFKRATTDFFCFHDFVTK